VDAVLVLAVPELPEPLEAPEPLEELEDEVEELEESDEGLLEPVDAEPAGLAALPRESVL